MTEAFLPRPAQKEILAYRGGTMGVSAVPGSGKTWTLSLLAAELIKNKCIADDQEVLVVTLVNSAVQNFSKRISSFLEAFGLLPNLGYRVRTLHGLSHDIVIERPELAGLDSSFQIIDDNEATRIRQDAVRSWLNNNPSILDGYLIPDLSESRLANLRQNQYPQLLNQISLQYIRTSKNLGFSPVDIETRFSQSETQMPLVNFGLDIYRDYQKNLAYRGAVDFDDLIIKAHQILSLDESLLHRLQHSWPYILEDESQDSSQLQQNILTMLADQESTNNWVRVGDPNQAIYESFTTADPKLLIDFIAEADFNLTLPSSGRSSESIIRLANGLVDWSISSHPNPQARDALFPNYIHPAPPGDSQPNPKSHPDQIHLYEKALDPDEELHLISRSAAKWLKDNPDATAAILAPRNERGKKMASLLRDEHGIEPVELLTSTIATRKTIGALVQIISYLIDPGSSKKLSTAFLVFCKDKRGDTEEWTSIERLAISISSLDRPEIFLSPAPDQEWIEPIPEEFHPYKNVLEQFRSLLLLWQDAAQLPIDQLILTISAEIFQDPASLALSHKVAAHERRLSNLHPDWKLPELLDEMRSLARNERRIIMDSDDRQFNPDDHKGKIVVTTAHKAKGLEWDRVYLMSANNYNFPSGIDGDIFISEKWFIRDNLNLSAETLKHLSNIADSQSTFLSEGIASEEARDEYVRERVRLFYVSLTRAKKELIITWNTGRTGKNSPCEAFSALVKISTGSEVS